METKPDPTKTALNAVDIFLDAVPQVGTIVAMGEALAFVNDISDHDCWICANAAVIAASRAIRSEANRRADEAHKMAFHCIDLPNMPPREITRAEILCAEDDIEMARRLVG